MHMEALDRNFSSGAHPDGVLGMTLYPHSPETQLNPLSQYSECIQPQFSTIPYDDAYQFTHQTPFEPCSPSPNSSSPLDTPMHSYSRTTSTSSYSSDASVTNLSSSQSSGFSDMPSISDLSISSDNSSSHSLSPDSALSNPFSSYNRRESKRKLNLNTAVGKPKSSRDKSVPRRSSAPAKGVSSESSAQASRKDSFIYDVQLESDNVLLFVPDLDLVKSHLMFAVREEVDVLKERIGELMERINHLEYENTVLRKYASPETLQQLQHPSANP
ncbi:TSC-22 / Dip / Bun [Trinorchestia longiramus]|nr:TSC-22 / Dip / Bun [Trinorchestia longiramus]